MDAAYNLILWLHPGKKNTYIHRQIVTMLSESLSSRHVNGKLMEKYKEKRLC